MGLIVACDAPFSIAHIIYIILNIICIIAGCILIKKKVNNPKTLEWILRISGIVLLIVVTIMKISETINHYNMDPTVKWYYVIPSTFCSYSAYVLGIIVLVAKKDNKVLHYITYMSLFGAALSTIYPDYLETVPFFSVEGITSLLHHSIQLWIVVVLFQTKYVIPKFKNIICFIVGYGIMIIVGVIEIYLIKIPTAMNVNQPLLSSLPILTSWWMMYIVGVIVVASIDVIYYLINKRKLED